MAIELLLTNKRLLHHPLLMVLIGIASVTIAVFLSWKIFPGSSSLVLVAFTIVPLVPLLMKLLEHEEYMHSHHHTNPRGLLRTHSVQALAKSKVLLLYSYLFLGLVVGFLMWLMILPGHVSGHIFLQQEEALYDFEGPGGFATFTTPTLETSCPSSVVSSYAPPNFGGCVVADFNKDGYAEYIMMQGDNYHTVVESTKISESYSPKSYSGFLFWHILQNNFVVLLFVFMTSFIYGAGALFILTWNASIIAFFFAEIFFGKFALYSLVTTLFHGIPEILGFLLASLSGGIVSVAFIRHKFMDAPFRQVFRDAFVIFMISIAFIIVGAGIEIL